MKTLTLTRSNALELFEAMGRTTADKWNNKRMEVKLAKADEMIDDDLKLKGKPKATLTKVLDAIENEIEIVVVDDEGATAQAAPAAAPAKGKTKAEAPAPKAKAKSKTPPPVEGEVDEEVEEVVDEQAEALEALKNRFDAGELTKKDYAAERKAIMDKAKGIEPKVKAAKAPKEPAEAKTPGVRETATRPYLAGKVIAKFGLANGITPEMVAELDNMYPKANEAESFGRLRNAWHVIRGFQDASAK